MKVKRKNEYSEWKRCQVWSWDRLWTSPDLVWIFVNLYFGSLNNKAFITEIGFDPPVAHSHSASWEYLSKDALALQHTPKNISSHTEQKSRAKRKRNYSLHYRNRHKIVRRNGEHGQNTQSIIHYAVKDRWRWYY